MVSSFQSYANTDMVILQPYSGLEADKQGIKTQDKVSSHPQICTDPSLSLPTGPGSSLEGAVLPTGPQLDSQTPRVATHIPDTSMTRLVGNLWSMAFARYRVQPKYIMEILPFLLHFLVLTVQARPWPLLG
jgi:hypothetical protein